MIENFVTSKEIKEFLGIAESPKDILDVLAEYNGRDIYLLGWDFAIKICSTKVENDKLKAVLEAYCPEHPDAKYQQEFYVSEEESLYNCFMEMTEPFREKHPIHRFTTFQPPRA